MSSIGSNRGDEPPARSRSLLLEEKFPPRTEHKGRPSLPCEHCFVDIVQHKFESPPTLTLICVGPFGSGVCGRERRDGDGLMLLCVLVIKTGLTSYVLLKIHDCLWHVGSASGWPSSARCGGQDLARTVQSCKTAQGCTDTRCAGLQHCVTLQDSLSIICLIGS